MRIFRAPVEVRWALAMLLALGIGCQGSAGKNGDPGTPGTPGTPGDPGPIGPTSPSTGTIAGSIKDASGAPLEGVSIDTNPASKTVTSAADGTFSLADVNMGSYAVTGSKSGYGPFTLANVGVAAGTTTNVSLVLQVAANAPGSISGRVTDAKSPAGPLAGVVVEVEGTELTATTAADGTYTISGVAPGPAFIAAKAPSAAFLDGETRNAAFVAAGGSATGIDLVLSARPTDAATYVGMSSACQACHSLLTNQVTEFKSSAHFRSLSDISANRLVNPTLAAPRVVNNIDTATTFTYNPAKLWPMDANDIVDPGVKAGAPDCNPAGPAGASGSPCPSVSVYLCQPSPGEYAMKFGGKSYTCADGNELGRTNPAPAGTVPLVRIAIVYGGEGDRDEHLATRPNLGVFKQRFLAPLSDVAVATAWTYTATADKARDTLTLPVQITQSGNGGPKFAGYHPTEQKFPGESWTQRSRTFSHACAGCHNTGMTIAWDMENVPINVNTPRDDGVAVMSEAAIKSYDYKDLNITCEHCHGPASEHIAAGGGKGKGIINPKYMTAEAERQMCGKCHAFDATANSVPAQDYGFEYPWNADNLSKIGNGDFLAGIFEIADYIGNWDERTVDEETFWDPTKTGGKLYGQAHRQQYTMLSFAKHTNNPYEKLTCSSCHDAHSLYRVSPAVSAGPAKYVYANADFRDNVQCLSCHAGHGPFAVVTKDDVARIHVSDGGTVTVNGAPFAGSTEAQTIAAEDAIAESVSKHMMDKTGMATPVYNPRDEALPIGRCTTCHMPKVAKSGGYTVGPNFEGKESIIEGDQASHVFDVIWPYESTARSVGGPTPFSIGYGTVTCTTSSNGLCNKLGYMPNSCSKCHDGARRASDIVPQVP